MPIDPSRRLALQNANLKTHISGWTDPLLTLRLYWQYLYKQSRTMRYVYTHVGDEKVIRNDVEYVHLKRLHSE